MVDSIEKFKSYLAGIGVENCPHNGGLECFDVNQAKLITDYFTDRYMIQKNVLMIVTSQLFLKITSGQNKILAPELLSINNHKCCLFLTAVAARLCVECYLKFTCFHSLFQHYKLYQFLFNQDPQEEVVVSEVGPTFFKT